MCLFAQKENVGNEEGGDFSPPFAFTCNHERSEEKKKTERGGKKRKRPQKELKEKRRKGRLVGLAVSAGGKENKRGGERHGRFWRQRPRQRKVGGKGAATPDRRIAPEQPYEGKLGKKRESSSNALRRPCCVSKGKINGKPDREDYTFLLLCLRGGETKEKRGDTPSLVRKEKKPQKKEEAEEIRLVHVMARSLPVVLCSLSSKKKERGKGRDVLSRSSATAADATKKKKKKKTKRREGSGWLFFLGISRPGGGGGGGEKNHPVPRLVFHRQEGKKKKDLQGLHGVDFFIFPPLKP